MTKDINYNSDAQEFASFLKKEAGTNKAYIMMLIMISLVAIFIFSPLFYDAESIVADIPRLTYKLKAVSGKIALPDIYENLSYWIDTFGLYNEYLSFSVISVFMLHLCLFVCEEFNSSLIISFFIVFSVAVMQVTFAIMACWKVWLLCLAYSWIKSFYFLKPYYSSDILGVAGNNHIFFSGVRASIKKCDENGNPLLHIPGLTCLSQAPRKIYQESALCQLLEEYGADNFTNQYLASTILNYYDYPAFIRNGTAVGNLFEDSYDFLFSAFEIKKAIDSVEDINEVEMWQTGTKKDDMFFCLTENMKEDLKNISYRDIATTILALETGRIMAYDRISNDRWAIVSNYPHLGARAVLHSTPFYGEEYSFEEREFIRQALIFTERKSDFLQIRMPLKMSLHAYTLRQWLELILNYDKKNEILDELLYFAKSTEIHKKWATVICDFIKEKQNLENNFYLTEGGSQLFVKLELINKILPQDFKDELINIGSLIKKIYEKREADNLISNIEQKKLSDDNNDFLKEFSNETKNDLKRFLNSERDIEAWQNLRSCLNSFSWLGKRVADRYVSYSGVIDCNIFLLDDTKIVQDGMVFLRTSKFIDFIGENWNEAIFKVKGVSITKASSMKLEGE